MQVTSTVVLSIPAQIALNRVGLKKSLVESRFRGLQCDIDGPTRQVTLSGCEAHLNDASDVFRKLFDQMAVTAPRANRLCPTSCNRSFVALGPDATYWRFVPTRSDVSDVKTCNFPFELERSPMKNDQQHEVLTSDRGPQFPRWKFLGELNDQYLMREAEKLNHSQQRDSLKLKAVFGRKLFSCESLEQGAEYHIDTLRDHHRNDRFRNNWSNICDTDGPELTKLLSKLRAAQAKLGITPCKEEIAVHLKPFGRSRNDTFKIKYFRSEGEWTYKSTKRPAGCVFAHDISLADRANFRVRAYNKLQQVGLDDPSAHELQSVVVIQEPADGEDVFSSQVTLSNDARASLKWLSIKSVTVVPLHGVTFRIVQLGEGELILEAHLPEASDMPLGDRFKRLIEQLREVVMISDGDNGDGTSDSANDQCL